MRKLDLVALTKLKIALAAPGRIIGVNFGCGHDGETQPEGDWTALRPSGEGKGDLALSMVLEPMYLLTGSNFEDYEKSYDIDVQPAEEASSAIFASEPLTENTDDWEPIEFGHIVCLSRDDGAISKSVSQLDV